MRVTSKREYTIILSGEERTEFYDLIRKSESDEVYTDELRDWCLKLQEAMDDSE